MMGSEEIFLVLNDEVVLSKIVVVRQQNVMLDKDLTLLYQVETKHFSSDFMYELTAEETKILRYKFDILSWSERSKYLSYCFTEHGILIL